MSWVGDWFGAQNEGAASVTLTGEIVSDEATLSGDMLITRTLSGTIESTNSTVGSAVIHRLAIGEIVAESSRISGNGKVVSITFATGGSTLVHKRLVETAALRSDVYAKEPAYLELSFNLKPEQLTILRLIYYYTDNNIPLRSYLTGIFLAYGAETALKELKVNFPRLQVRITDASTVRFLREQTPEFELVKE